jgi:hypothetical protein
MWAFLISFIPEKNGLVLILSMETPRQNQTAALMQ